MMVAIIVEHTLQVNCKWSGGQCDNFFSLRGLQLLLKDVWVYYTRKQPFRSLGILILTGFKLKVQKSVKKLFYEQYSKW